MAKLITWSNIAPIGTDDAGLGDNELQNIKTFIDDEHTQQGAAIPNQWLVHRQGSARAFMCTVATLPAPGAAPFLDAASSAQDTGRLLKETDGLYKYWNHGTLTWERIVGGRYSRVQPAVAAPFACLASTYTDITNFAIAGFNMTDGYMYRFDASIAIAYSPAIAAIPLGLRFELTPAAGPQVEYDFYFETNGIGYVVAHISVYHDHTGSASGAAGLKLQAARLLAGNLETAAIGLFGGGAGTRPHNLAIYEL